MHKYCDISAGFLYIIHRNDDRRSSLSLAAKNNELQVLSVLLNNNANVNDCDIDQVSKIKDILLTYKGCVHTITIYRSETQKVLFTRLHFGVKARLWW